MKKNKLREKYSELGNKDNFPYEVDNKNIGDKVVIIKKEKEEKTLKEVIFGKKNDN